MEPCSVNNPPSEKSREEEILELAKKELLRDIKCASIRAEQFGAHSWAKPQKYVPSKRFLKTLIVNDSRFNGRKEQQSIERRERGRGRSTSVYAEDKREHPDKGYLSHSRTKRKREISQKNERYSDNKSEKSSYEAEKGNSKREKHRKDFLPEIDSEGSSFNNRKEQLPEKGDRDSSLSKHHKRKKHPKKSKRGNAS